jgi:dTDP-4-amino-4,6-dideoxygalactose transaminase
VTAANDALLREEVNIAMPTTVPPFLIDLSPEEVQRALRDIKAILESGRLTLGPYAERFEHDFAEMVGVKHAVSVTTGSTALEIIFRASGVAGREVLVPTNTNFATAAAAIYAGASVGFFDGGLYPSFHDVERRISYKTAAVVVVHVGGYITPDILEIRRLCERRGILLIEDAAHAHHASHGGVQAGAFGHAAAFSFFPTKVMTTGEGGMIVTNDERLAVAARCLRDQGKDASGLIHVLMGNSWRLPEMGCALGLAQLGSLPSDTEHRQSVMKRYAVELAGCPGLSFPPVAEEMRPSGYKSVALLDAGMNRQRFVAAMADLGVTMARPVYEVPLHRQPVFKKWVKGTFPLADEFCDHHICLPLWRRISDAQQAATISAVRRVAAQEAV